MAGLKVKFVEKGTRTQFEAAIHRFGQGTARSAFSRAMNHEGRKAHTGIRRLIAKESGIRFGDVNKEVRYIGATKKELRATMAAQGAFYPLKYFGARQFKFGVRAKLWGRAQRFPGAFISEKLNGHVFAREGKARLPIGKLWGPSTPRELVKDAPVAVMEMSMKRIEARATHELSRLMNA